MNEQLNQINQTEISPEPQPDFQPKNPKRFNPVLWIYITAAILVIVGIGLGFYFIYPYFVPEPSDNLISVPEIIEPVAVDINSLKPYKLEVNWLPELVEQKQDNKKQDIKSYLLGAIINGDLRGRDLYLEVGQDMGRSFNHYILIEGQKYYVHQLYAENEDKNFEIKGVTDLPTEIIYPGTNYSLKKGGIDFSSEIKLDKKIFTYESIGDFYLSEEGCIVVFLPSHTAISYNFDTAISYNFELPFINRENGELKLTFDNGEKNNEEYLYTDIVGCWAFCRSLSEVKPEDIVRYLPVFEGDIVPVARTDSGEIFFEFKNSQDRTLLDLYNNKNTMAFYVSNLRKGLEKNKYSYKEYIAFHPLLYWKDPIGRWIRFKNKRFSDIAEICKPAIYLYPEQKTNLTVEVKPSGGFIRTIPDYGSDGWNVEVYPDGAIIDLSTGQKYDYLYWSGLGIDYPVNESEGWIIKKESIDSFLDEKLGELGLVDKEIKDFKEYWVNRLIESPYYHISFLPKEQIERIAPLKVSPLAPDNVIRVIMTARGLSEFVSVKEQKLPLSAKRDGFTLVEWGGVLLR